MINKNPETVGIVFSFLCKTKFILVFTDTGLALISAFASLIDIPVGITTASVRWNVCEITSRVKNYDRVIKKMKKQWQNKIISKD